MRYYLRKGVDQSPSDSAQHWMAEERKLKLDVIDGYRQFKTRVDTICHDLVATLKRFQSQGERVAGYGATSKSTTLLNYAKIGPDLVEYISDTTPNKIGKFTPGTPIPIKSYDDFKKDHINVVLLFAWNHKKEIFEKEQMFRKSGGKFITYFPKVTIE